VNFDAELDTRGLLCPLPILKTRFALEPLPAGAILKVISTDRGSLLDMEAFARQTGHRLLQSSDEGGEYVFYFEKA